jgi:hypothetical protein
MAIFDNCHQKLRILFHKKLFINFAKNGLLGNILGELGENHPATLIASNVSSSGLPDGLFSIPKSQFWVNLGGPYIGKC